MARSGATHFFTVLATLAAGLAMARGARAEWAGTRPLSEVAVESSGVVLARAAEISEDGGDFQIPLDPRCGAA